MTPSCALDQLTLAPLTPCKAVQVRSKKKIVLLTFSDAVFKHVKYTRGSIQTPDGTSHLQITAMSIHSYEACQGYGKVQTVVWRCPLNRHASYFFNGQITYHSPWYEALLERLTAVQ